MKAKKVVGWFLFIVGLLIFVVGLGFSLLGTCIHYATYPGEYDIVFIAMLIGSVLVGGLCMFIGWWIFRSRKKALFDAKLPDEPDDVSRG